MNRFLGVDGALPSGLDMSNSHSNLGALDSAEDATDDGAFPSCEFKSHVTVIGLRAGLLVLS
jgi:hypothetical protein